MADQRLTRIAIVSSDKCKPKKISSRVQKELPCCQNRGIQEIPSIMENLIMKQKQVQKEKNDNCS
ncbi:hypothetical protein OROMI_033931 [Orobanche minor]